MGELRTVCGWVVVVSRLLMRGKLIRELLQRERRKKGEAEIFYQTSNNGEGGDPFGKH